MAKAKVVIRGNVKACSYCEAFMGAGGLMDGADYAKLLPGADVVVIEANASPAAFKANKERLSGKWPIVAWQKSITDKAILKAADVAAQKAVEEVQQVRPK